MEVKLKMKDFKESYKTACSLKGNYPLKNVTSFLDDDILDVNADKLDNKDWCPLIEALKTKHRLRFIAIRRWSRNNSISKRWTVNQCEKSNSTTRNDRNGRKAVDLYGNAVSALTATLEMTSHLTCLELQNLPLSSANIKMLSSGLYGNRTLQHLSLQQCPIGDVGVEVIFKVLKNCFNVTSINLSQCALSWKSAEVVATAIKHQSVHRYSDAWKETLRNEIASLDVMGGIQRLTLNGNPLIGDKGAEMLAEMLRDDLWIKAIDVQDCGVQEKGAAAFLKALKHNTTLFILDIRRNFIRDRDLLLRISQQLSFNTQGQTSQFKWFKVPCDVDKRNRRTALRKRGIPWRVTARLSSVRHLKPNYLPGIPNVFFQSKPSLMGFSSDDRTETGSNRSSVMIGKRNGKEKESIEILNAIRTEISQVREMLRKEKEARFEAEKRISRLVSENEELKENLTLLDETTLATIEETFRKFNDFLSMLKEVGYGNLFEEYSKGVTSKSVPITRSDKSEPQQQQTKLVSLKESNTSASARDTLPSSIQRSSEQGKVSAQMVSSNNSIRSNTKSESFVSTKRTTQTSESKSRTTPSGHSGSQSNINSSNNHNNNRSLTMSLSKLSLSSHESLTGLLSQSDKF